ncbi:MAG: hypothetical protein AAF250_01765 [Pseudomonadota bacterium]
MPVITTQSNQVVAYEPGPDDKFVKVVWHGPGEDGERYLKAFHGPYWPIEQYEQTVEWAVSMADQMRFPLHVVPRSGVDYVKSDELRSFVAGLDDQERGELRRFVVNRLAEVMRDCQDPDVRADAHGVLADMGLVDP